MDEIKLAMLGDWAAQERLTENGILVNCHRCGGKATISNKFYRDTKYPEYAWNIKCGKCGYEMHGFASRIIMDDSGEVVLLDGFDGRKETIRRWNTRAPILGTEELETINEKL